MNNYDDIINLPHHVSKNHPQMSLENRSAQFAPYAALTGYEDEIKETASLTTRRIELDDEEKAILDIKLKKILAQIHNKPTVTFTYFVPDIKKQGGKYITIAGTIKKANKYEQTIILEDNTEIPISEITDIFLLEHTYT